MFSSLSTQWRMGGGGPIGLDYNVLFYRLDRMKLSDAEHDQLFADVQVVEATALGILNSKEPA